MAATLEPLFLDAGPGRTGQRFCILHPPQGSTARGAAVYIHPFAEEMNKSRRMAALQSRGLAAQGFAVLQIDLLGCGDSSGDFGDASWDEWIEDVLLAARWLRGKYDAPQWLWGLRAGCLLATAAAERLQERVNFLFWQPSTQGKVVLQQFLRLKLASDMLGGAGKAAMDDLKLQLAAGHRVDIAGYSLAPALADGLQRATLAVPSRPGHLAWLEVSSRDEPTLLPTAALVLSGWRDAAATVDARAVRGPAFWQTSEIETAPELLAATLVALPDEVVA